MTEWTLNCILSNFQVAMKYSAIVKYAKWLLIWNVTDLQSGLYVDKMFFPTI